MGGASRVGASTMTRKPEGAEAQPPALDPIEQAREIATRVARPMAEAVDREGRFPSEGVAALREAELLSLAVPRSLGGAGADLATIARVCTELGAGCASSGMILAMHSIQVACLVDSLDGPGPLADHLRRLAREQRLVASVTSEVGTDGDLRRSVTAVESEAGGGFRLEKATPTSSYCEYAEDLLVTARRGPDSAGSDQVLVLLTEDGFALEDVGAWDTLGMRGTCSPPARIVGRGADWQVLATPFREIAPETMVPWSHVLWSAVWFGIARDATERARAHLRKASRRDPDGCEPMARRVAQVCTRLEAFRALVEQAAQAETRRREGEGTEEGGIARTLRHNDLKLAASEAVVGIVTEALQAIGMSGYRNGGPASLGRHLRDAHSAALMIHNDRLRGTNADLLLVHKGR